MRNLIQANAKQAVAVNKLRLVAGTSRLRSIATSGNHHALSFDSQRCHCAIEASESRVFMASVSVLSGTTGIYGPGRLPAPISYCAGLGDGVSTGGNRMAVVERRSNWQMERQPAFQAAA